MANLSPDPLGERCHLTDMHELSTLPVHRLFAHPAYAMMITLRRKRPVTFQAQALGGLDGARLILPHASNILPF